MVGPACAELAQGSFLSDLGQSYRRDLEEDGVTFPTPEVEEVSRLSTAAAQIARGAAALEDDGSFVNLEAYDAQVAAEILRANRGSLLNNERLASLTYLGLISHGGSLMRSQIIDVEGIASANAEAVLTLNTLFKEFVQLGIATEEWGSPWNAVVANRFEGPSLSFPLNVKEVNHGLAALRIPLFKALKSQHFGRLSLHGFNLFQGLDLSDAGNEVEPVQLSLAANIALFYRHSPQGCTDLLHMALKNGSLSEDVDWQAAIDSSVARAGQIFDRP